MNKLKVTGAVIFGVLVLGSAALINSWNALRNNRQAVDQSAGEFAAAQGWLGLADRLQQAEQTLSHQETSGRVSTHQTLKAVQQAVWKSGVLLGQLDPASPGQRSMTALISGQPAQIESFLHALVETLPVAQFEAIHLQRQEQAMTCRLTFSLPDPAGEPA